LRSIILLPEEGLPGSLGKPGTGADLKNSIQVTSGPNTASLDMEMGKHSFWALVH